MPDRYDSVLLVAFGGPTPGCCRKYDPCRGEAFCFVEGILGDTPERAARVQEVARHYEEIGGVSPFNFLTFKQAGGLEMTLRERGVTLPVYAGMRHWAPTLRDTLAAMARDGRRRALGIVLAPHQSSVSWDWYLEEVAKAREAVGADAPVVECLDPTWYTAEGFVAAIVAGIRRVTAEFSETRLADAALAFTAHAVPLAIAEKAPYCQQFQETAAAVAAALGRDDHRIAYQSQASDASIPWTGPDVNDLIRELARERARDVIVSPVGFLCDHVEVLYDLDVEARKTAAEAGVHFFRADTVGCHPRFLHLLADRVLARLPG